jgi:hypothetical protein
MAQLNPVHVIVAGLIGAALFVAAGRRRWVGIVMSQADWQSGQHNREENEMSPRTAAPPDYFVPAPSSWPMVGMIGLGFTGFGAAHGGQRLRGGWVLLPSASLVLVYMMFGWFGDVIGESEGGLLQPQVDARSAGA